ncbi:MAG: dihydrofolate reductase [Actinomycetales bacterium]
MTVTLVAAVGRNGVIGRHGDLAVRISEDLRRFKALTMGHPMVMGRKTWDSMGGPLPGRRSIVLTRDHGWRADGAEVTHSVPSALEMAGPGPVFVVGGGELYRQTIHLADALELTEVDQYLEGDVFFPPLDRAAWVEVARDARDGYAFVRYERAGPPAEGSQAS